MKDVKSKKFSSEMLLVRFELLPLWAKISTIIIPVATLLVAVFPRERSNLPMTVVNGPAIIDNSVSRDYHGEYVLKNNILIDSPYVSIRGMNTEGDVNFNNSNGSNIKEMGILENEDSNLGGSINVKNSKIGTVSENTVQKNINVNNSEVDALNKNIVGVPNR